MIATVVIVILLLVLLSIYRKEYERRLGIRQKDVEKSNKELVDILQKGHLQMWTYDVDTGTYAWMVEERAQLVTLQPQQFYERYTPKVCEHIKLGLQELIRGEKQRKVLRVAVMTPDGTKRYVAIDMSVVRRDKLGNTMLIATYQCDVTEVHLREMRDREVRMRYESIFNSGMTDMVYYNAQGLISDMNSRACETFGIDLETAKSLGISIEMAVNEPGFDHHHFDIFHATQFRDSTLAENKAQSQKLQGKMCYEILVAPVFDARHHMVCAYGSGINVTETADAYYVMQESIRKTHEANEGLADYVRNIDFAMKVGGVRIVKYDPKTRMLTIYKETNTVQLIVSADRAMRFVDSTSYNIVQHMFEKMDTLTTIPFNHQIKTIIRRPGGLMLHLYVYFMPTYDDNHNVNGYFGMLRDFTEAKAIERQLANETIRARQEETQKNAFMRNMSFEMRTLLNAVVGFADLFQQEHATEDEPQFISQIKDNGTQLLELVNGILILSRLNAGMIESKPRRIDLTQMLDSWSNAGYEEHPHKGVKYIVDHPYKRFVTDIDAINLGIVITQLCSNGARLTKKGCVRTYYDYKDGQLAISVESHGKGISEQQLQHIFEHFGSAMETQTGLSLPVCYGLMQLMGGTVNIKSDYGKETTITVMLPCQPVEIVPQ